MALHETDSILANLMTMKKLLNLAVAASLLSLVIAAGAQPANAESKVRWIDAQELCIEGKGWTDTKHFYDRLPAKAEGVVRDAVWNLGTHSAGICVHFTTDATDISARWTVRNGTLGMPHMPATGVSGLDLYVRHKGEWRWLGAGRPEKITTEQKLASGMSPEPHEYLLYLPLYNGTEKLEIGLPPEAKCQPCSPRSGGKKPVVFYGTSIVQGGCASRPGMACAAILGRRFDCPTINLGFSGSALCEPEVANLLAELDPSAYVLDPLPNMKPESVSERMSAMIVTLREKHPKTPIVLVEHIDVGSAQVLPARRAGYSKSNAALREIFEQRVRAGDRKLFYVRGDKLLGTDGQGTVDGVHPTDLGFMRMADAIEPVLKRVKLKSQQP